MKPRRNPGHIVFPKVGPVRTVIEEFPRQQDDLELAVGRKFLGALQHFRHVTLVDLFRGTEPADLVCKSEDGAIVNVQVAEAVNEGLRELRSMRETYREAIVRELAGDILLFNGCRVSLVDSGDPPYLPKVSTKDGSACVAVMLEHIRKVDEDLSTLPKGKMRLRSVYVGLANRKVGVLVERIQEPSDPPRLQFQWSGSGPSYRVDVSRQILTTAVRKKIGRHYSKPSKERFLLLVYSVDTLLSEEDPDIKETRELLDGAAHPFDEVWYFFPYAEKTLGHLVQVWPAQSSA